MKIKLILAVGLLFCVGDGICMADSLEMFYPPLINGKPDFSGKRFTVRDARGIFKGKRPSMMKKGFICRYETPPGHHSLPPHVNLYLARDTEEEDEIDVEDSKDTLIKYVHTLNDLKGFVRIRSETDALEFLRFGSCGYNYTKFSTVFEELFCIRDTSVLPSEKDNPALEWATEEQCRRFNFSPPKILNPMTTKERKEMEKGEDNEKGSKEGRQRGKAKRGFLIERTVEIGPHSTLETSDSDIVFRVLEEVGPEGQWRIVSSTLIPISQKDYDIILFQSNLPFK